MSSLPYTLQVSHTILPPTTSIMSSLNCWRVFVPSLQLLILNYGQYNPRDFSTKTKILRVVPHAKQLRFRPSIPTEHHVKCHWHRSGFFPFMTSIRWPETRGRLRTIVIAFVLGSSINGHYNRNYTLWYDLVNTSPLSNLCGLGFYRRTAVFMPSLQYI